MRTLIAGYRPYELGIFKSSQKEVTVLKLLLRHKALEYIESGTEWFIIQGYSGIELYAGEMILELKNEGYEVGLAVLMPFYEFNSKYKEEDAAMLQKIISGCDFHDYIFKKPYENPAMFKQINRFLVTNTDQGLIIYDDAADSKVRFLYEQILEFSGNHPYNIERIEFDEINTFAELSYDS